MIDQSGLMLIGSVARPQLPASAPSPGPDTAVFVQREIMIPSTGCKHTGDVTDALKNMIIRTKRLDLSSDSNYEHAAPIQKALG